MNIKYLPYIEINFYSSDIYTKYLEYQPTEYIHSLYKKFMKEGYSGKFNLKNLTSEVKPSVGYYLYSLVKENRFNKILQIGIRNGIDALYLNQGLVENNKIKDKHLDIILIEKGWEKNTEKTLKELNSPYITLYKQESYLQLPELVEEEKMYNMILIKGYHLFDSALIDFFYADKLLNIGGIVVLFDKKFESSEKLAKYIQTNFKNYKLLPKNLGSEYCYTFVKIAEDTRRWFFHENF